jgi:hypothetical protein
VTFLFAVRTVCILTFAPLLTAREGLIGAAIALLAAEAIVQILAAASARKSAPHLFAGLGPRVLTIAFSSLMGALVGLALDAMIPSVVGFVVAVVLATAVSAGLLWFLDRRLRLGLATDLLRLFPELAQLLPGLFPSPSV